MLSATQARKHCPVFWKQHELNNRLIKDVHWDAISGRLECQSQIATLGPARPIVDPRIRTIYDVKHLDFDRSRSVKPQGVYKLRYRSEAIKSEPTIELENDGEDVAEDVTGSIVKRERDEDLVESSMPATKRARQRRNKR
ncbi:hypothetical protein BOTCAL_0113g00160 [Botryotinia calthae]|uniref:Uncharacterized protein n=1 Tax=Botryotinia calthae TaxID=38488 RepID=A0A4Y8D575_9HELO|nr:hypothetical protein BOTCAL_0113g00160 [Botryotinia calthae]